MLLTRYVPSNRILDSEVLELIDAIQELLSVGNTKVAYLKI